MIRIVTRDEVVKEQGLKHSKDLLKVLEAINEILKKSVKLPAIVPVTLFSTSEVANEVVRRLREAGWKVELVEGTGNYQIQ